MSDDSAVKAALKKLLHLLPHKPRSILLYIRKHRSLPHFRSPRTFSEHIHHRKLFQHDPRFAVLADKVRVKDVVARSRA